MPGWERFKIKLGGMCEVALVSGSYKRKQSEQRGKKEAQKQECKAGIKISYFTRTLRKTATPKEKGAMQKREKEK